MEAEILKQCILNGDADDAIKFSRHAQSVQFINADKSNIILVAGTGQPMIWRGCKLVLIDTDVIAYENEFEIRKTFDIELTYFMSRDEVTCQELVEEFYLGDLSEMPKLTCAFPDRKVRLR